MGEQVNLVFYEDTNELPNNNVFYFNEAGDGNYKLVPVVCNSSNLQRTRKRLCCLVDPTDDQTIDKYRDTIRTYERDENGLLVMRIAKKPYMKKRSSV